MISTLFSTVIAWYMAHINYPTIMLLMAIESSFIPFPSEVVIPPAAWKAAQGDLNVYLVFLFSTLGSLIGALFNYYFALFFGRKIVYQFAESRFGRLLLLSRQGVEKAETYFVRHGPHHSAQKSITTGLSAFITTSSKLPSVISSAIITYI